MSVKSAPRSAPFDMHRPQVVGMSKGDCPWESMRYIAAEGPRSVRRQLGTEILWSPWRACNPAALECCSPQSTHDVNSIMRVGMESIIGLWDYRSSTWPAAKLTYALGSADSMKGDTDDGRLLVLVPRIL